MSISVCVSAAAPESALDWGARERGIALHGGADDGDQLGSAHVLVHEAVNAGGAGLFDERDLGHARHDYHAHVGVRLLDGGGSDDAAGIVFRAHVQKR